MKVSVVIPCYNAEKFIGQAIGSVLEQSLPVSEIIVVDDGSTDRSAEIALNFGDPVKVLSKQGGGAPNARNCGADHASGDAIMFLDADDVLGPDVIEHLTTQLKKNPDGIVACPWYRLVKIGGKWVKRSPSCEPLGEDQDYLSGWLTGWYHLPCSILWSQTAYENSGGWDPRAYVNNDGDLMMRALVYGVDLQITENGASFYRKMPDEMLTETLSGKRFTRKGRKAQIYVVHKIAQMLEDRGRLKNYRQPITKALEQYRDKCQPHYPDLSERCSELIVQFGEPRYKQIRRKFRQNGHQAVQSIHRMLWLLKKRVLMKIRGNHYSAKRRDKKNYEEIRYGLDTWQKFKNAGEKGDLMKPSTPDVSVIMPLTDDAEAFNNSLKNVLNQELESYEVIIPGSKPPGTVESEVGTIEDSRIRFVRSEKNEDFAEILNKGLKEVKGDFVAFLNPGDEWHPAKLARQAEYFKNASGKVGLVYTGSEFVDHQRKTTEFLPVEKGNVYKKLLRQNFIDCFSSVMIRRTVIPAIGFFDPHLPGYQNHDFWFRVSRFFKFEFIEDALVKCVIRNDEESSKKSDIDRKSQQLFLDKYRRELKTK